jgi:hypothetical protein
MTYNIFEPPAIIIPAPPSQEQIQIVAMEQQQEISEVTNEQIHEYSLFKHSNKHLAKDGRTYIEQDSDGNYISHYVSQYSNKFWNGLNVEKGIEPVVQALHQKGYLTFTSCQGHANSPMRYVGIAFINDEERSRFVDAVTASKLPVTWYYDCVNPKDEPAKNKNGNWMRLAWDQKNTKITTQKEFTDLSYTKQELTDFWNIMFCRKYQSYSPVLMCVACNMEPKDDFDYYFWKLKYFGRTKTTKNLARYINQELSQYLW